MPLILRTIFGADKVEPCYKPRRLKGPKRRGFNPWGGDQLIEAHLCDQIRSISGKPEAAMP